MSETTDDLEPRASIIWGPPHTDSLIAVSSPPPGGLRGGSALVVHSLIPPSHLPVLQMSSRVGFLLGGGEGPFGFYAY